MRTGYCKAPQSQRRGACLPLPTAAAACERHVSGMFGHKWAASLLSARLLDCTACQKGHPALSFHNQEAHTDLSSSSTFKRPRPTAEAQQGVCSRKYAAGHSRPQSNQFTQPASSCPSPSAVMEGRVVMAAVGADEHLMSQTGARPDQQAGLCLPHVPPNLDIVCQTVPARSCAGGRGQPAGVHFDAMQAMQAPHTSLPSCCRP